MDDEKDCIDERFIDLFARDHIQESRTYLGFIATAGH